MVPVLDENRKPLFPCKERRARRLLERGEAKVLWQKGIFCIQLIRKHSDQRENYPDIAASSDPGSLREGYTVMTPSSVVFNITTNTPNWIKSKVETKRNLRRSRRYRKTPYRKCRSNRGILRKSGRIPPSTKARWDAKLRTLKFLLSILPITIINVEDIKADTKPGKRRWNKSFSPLEIGKRWFYSEIKKLGVKLMTTKGTKTCAMRITRGLEKSTKKLDYTWEAHNSDSHILCEIAIGVEVKPFKGIWQMEYLQFNRRELHRQVCKKGQTVRSPYGSTISMGMSRGSVIEYNDKLGYLGGSSKGKVSIHSLITGKRITQTAKIEDIKVITTNKRRVQFLPRLKSWVSLQKFL